MDLSRFHETFFQESLEGISVMETGLLALSAAVSGEEDPETIHNVFRAAHSIKGGSATFGFKDIAEFTHLLETFLGTVRETGAKPEGTVFEALLQAVDWLRELMKARLEDREPDQALMERATADLAALLGNASRPSGESADLAKTSISVLPSQSTGTAHPPLSIRFQPYSNLFLTGNDPLLYLSQLEDLGLLTSVVNLDKLPSLTSLNTEESYLTWDLKLNRPTATAAQAREVFEWISDDCDLDIRENSMDPSPSTEAAAKKSDAAPAAAREGASIRVATRKIDALVNLVGELVITQSMLTCIGENIDVSHLEKLRQGIAQLTRNTRELQETVLQIRMLPVSNLFERFPRLIHDLSRKLEKSVRLEITGGQTELDKTVLEKLGDPLVHLVRNSMDHGLELPHVRRQAGKPEEGVLHLHAEHRGGNVVIEISDDGAGLNEERILTRAIERGLVAIDQAMSSTEIQELIFAPGFSTVVEVTDLSGRGVGMDVVRRNVEDLGGRVDLSSRQGFGTTISIQLPLTMAIMEGQLLRVGEERFVLPLVSIVESLSVNKTALHTIAGGIEIYRLRDEYLRVVHLEKLFNLESAPKTTEEGLLVVVESRGNRFALRVDDLLAQQQVVIKSLETNFGKVDGLSGVTILGDGGVAMILDVAGLMGKLNSKVPELSQAEP